MAAAKKEAQRDALSGKGERFCCHILGSLVGAGTKAVNLKATRLSGNCRYYYLSILGLFGMNASQPQDFWSSPLGRRVLDAEQAILAAQLRRLHGTNALWTGETPTPLKLLESCMVRQGVFVHHGAHPDPSQLRKDVPWIKGALDSLPFAKNEFESGKAQSSNLKLRYAFEKIFNLLLSVL